MIPKLSKKAARIKELERQVRELEAQLIHVYHFASYGIPNATRAKIMGSAVIVQMHYLGGKEVCPPFALKDGLSPETIEALKADIRYSYDKTAEFKP